MCIRDSLDSVLSAGLDTAQAIADGKPLAAIDSALKTAEKVQKMKEDTTDRQTTDGTSGGGGNKTNVVAPRRGDMVHMFTEVPEVQTNREVSVRNTLYTQVTVEPPTYEEGIYTREPASAYLSGVKWTVPPCTDYAATFWANWVSRFQLLAQMRCGFNVQAVTRFSYARMELYVNSISTAISTYLFYANTYQYTVLNGKNTARNGLRDMFDVSDLQYLQLLAERLNDLPIPPRLYNELAHLYAIYHTSDASGTSSSYSFTPLSLDGGSGNLDSIPTDTQGIKYCLQTLLQDEDFIGTTDMLSRVLPEWVAVKVGTSQYSAHLYDRDHLNVFMNSPMVTNDPGESTDVMYSPTYTSRTGSGDEQHYISTTPHATDIRGDQQAMFSVYDYDALSECWSGFLVPVTSATDGGSLTNRYKYAKGASGNALWRFDNTNPWNTTTHIPAKGSSIYANTVDGTFKERSTPLGTYRLEGMTVAACNTVQDNYLSFLLDIGNLGITNDGRGKDTFKKGKRRGKR